MNKSLKFQTLVGGLLMALPVGTAMADGSYPQISIVIPIEIQNDYAYESDDPTAELNDTFATIEPEITVQFSEQISVVAGLVFEPVQDAVDDRFFDDEGIYFEQLFVQYEGDGFGIIAGKFNPVFGVAWDKAPGIYGVDFAEDYELAERVGFGANVTLGGEAAGEHTLSAATFFADTSFLSQSTITGRGETRGGSGGPSNTEDLSSFSLSLDSESVPALGGIGYTLGVAHQAAGEGDTDDETAYVVGAFTSFELSEDLTFEPLIEWVHLDHAGASIADTDYLTLSGALLHGPWNLSASYTGRSTDPNTAGTPDVDDTLYQLSAGYEFENGFTADLGYRFAEEAAIDTHVIGVLFTYELSASFP